MILGLFTSVFQVGGIEQISKHTAAVLERIADDRGEPCRLLSLNDPPGHYKVQVGDGCLTIRGFGRRKIRFVLSVLAAAPRAHLAYIGHPNIAPLGLLVRLLRPGARYCVASYGWDVWERLSFIRRLGLRFASSVTTLSCFTGERLVISQRVDPRKITILPPALEPGFLRRDDPVHCVSVRIPSRRLLLSVARLAASEGQKGIDTMIRALPKVLKVVEDIEYVIVGDGDDRPRLERLARETQVAGQVVFAGIKMGDELAGYYDACDIFVMPSGQEGFGVVFLEAMAFGKPAIGANSGGIPEVVIDGVTGFLVEYGDEDALADRLICLLGDKKLCERMGEAGRRRVEENYTFDHFCQRLSRVLGESMG